MDYAIAQDAAFVAFGNAYMQGKEVFFAKNNPVAKYYRNISFREKFSFDPVLAPAKILAKNPNDWFRYLVKEGFDRVYLSYLPTAELPIPPKIKEASTNLHKNEHFILTLRKEKCTFWHSQWVPVSGDLQILYYPIIDNSPIDLSRLPTLEEAKEDFTAVLTELVAFTKENKLTNWSNVFQRALDYFGIKDPSKILSGNLFPEGCFSLEALQLFAACDQAWVFGGMGSWNDVSNVSDYEKYKELSARLIGSINNSVVAFANSYP